MNPVAKFLIVAGVLLILAGVFWQFGGRMIPFGRLPGDIAVERKNFGFYFPLTSSLVASVILSLALYLIGRFFR